MIVLDPIASGPRYVNANSPKSDGTPVDLRDQQLGPSSLRHAIYEMMLRSDDRGDMSCLYRVSDDFHKQHLTGERAFSGVTSKHDMSYKNVEYMKCYMGSYKAASSQLITPLTPPSPKRPRLSPKKYNVSPMMC